MSKHETSIIEDDWNDYDSNAGDIEKRGLLKGRLRSKKWRHWLNIIAVLSVIFVGEAARGLVVPSLFLYLENIGGGGHFLSYVVAGFSVGRLFGSILLGWWYNKSGPKQVLVGSLLISIIGNLLYSFGGVTDKWTVFVSRILVGFGSGTLSPVRATLADVSTKEQRVRFMALSNAIQFVGFAILPGAAELLTYVEFNVGSFRVDRYTSPGFVLAILNLITMIGVIIFSYNKQEMEAYKERKDEMEEFEKSYEKDSEPEVSPTRLWVGAILFITLNLVTRGVLALLETVGAPIFVQVWHSSKDNAVQDSSRMFLILGCAGLGIYLIVDRLRKWIPEHLLLAGSFAGIGVGALCFVNYTGAEHITIYQFIIGAAIIWSIMSPISQTLILSTYSKMLGSKPQGSTMGWIGAAGSVGRILFPMLSVAGNNPSFIISAIVAVLSAASVLVFKAVKPRATNVSLQA